MAFIRDNIWCFFVFVFLMLSEVTKVRRNLFNQEMISPSKRSAKRGLPRSHSVSAVEGLEYKPDNLKKPKGIIFQGNREEWGSWLQSSPQTLFVAEAPWSPLFSSLWLPSVFPLGVSLPPSLGEDVILGSGQPSSPLQASVLQAQ